MSDGLKPCPFCGGPEIPPSQIYCATCKTNISGLGDLWNTRPIEDALQARIVELEIENAKLLSAIQGANNTARRRGDRITELEAENTALRAELVRWLEALASTPPEALWELREPRMRQVSIQVNKKDYEAARKRLGELR